MWTRMIRCHSNLNQNSASLHHSQPFTSLMDTRLYPPSLMDSQQLNAKVISCQEDSQASSSKEVTIQYNIMEGLGDTIADLHSSLDLVSSNSLVHQEEPILLRKLLKQITNCQTKPESEKQVHPNLKDFFENLINGPIISHVVEIKLKNECKWENNNTSLKKNVLIIKRMHFFPTII